MSKKRLSARFSVKIRLNSVIFAVLLCIFFGFFLISCESAGGNSNEKLFSYASRDCDFTLTTGGERFYVSRSGGVFTVTSDEKYFVLSVIVNGENAVITSEDFSIPLSADAARALTLPLDVAFRSGEEADSITKIDSGGTSVVYSDAVVTFGEDDLPCCVSFSFMDIEHEVFFSDFQFYNE